MRKMKTNLFFFAFCIPFFANAQNNYSNFTRQTERLNTLAKAYPQYAKLRSIVKTVGGKDIWQLTIGTGNTDNKPGIAVIGGTEGTHLLGTELAIGFAENLLQASNTDSIKNLLNKTTYYIFPNMSPDAMEQYFAPLKYERQGNAGATDDDRDGKTNEDGPDDLDGDGRITKMRVESPIGDYRIHPDFPGLLIKADINKGEKGNYLVYTEGVDNDHDGLFNEDGEGGTWFNKNLTYKHPSFTPGAGEFAVSEKETRALLDLLYEQYNVFALICFGSNNNLSTPYVFNTLTASTPVPSSWLQQDVKADSLVSELYNRVTGMKDAPKTTPAGGDLLSWGYYHYGRYSFGTPGWWIPKTKPDSTLGEKALATDDPTGHYMRWAGRQKITTGMNEWKIIQHPDFPNAKVEVGGFDPFLPDNPPYDLVPDLVKKHTSFLTKLAGYQPETDLVNLRKEGLGNGLTRISVDVINKGVLASHTKVGEKSYWVKRINVKLNTTGNQSVISGKKIQVLNSLEGSSTQQLSWLVKGSGKIILEAGSPTTGIKSVEVIL